MEITSKYSLRQNIKSRCCRKDFVKLRRCRKLDFFSRLRDDFIIFHILSRLMPRDAAKCCLISRRWRSLWEQSLACKFIFTYVRGNQDKLLSDNRRNEERRRFASWVNKFLDLSHHNPNIHEFVVQFDLDSSYSSDINKWLCFAFAKGVERLELDFSLYLYHGDKDYYTFPGVETLPALLGSHNNNCRMNSLRNSCGATLHKLRDICFKYVDIDGKTIEYMLSKCHSLERLRVKCSRTLISLNVCGESIRRLKHLGIVDCENISNVNVSISSLVSLKYSGSRKALHIGYVPSLSEVSIGGKYCGAFLRGKGTNLKCVSDQLRRLKLNMSCKVVKKCVHYPLDEFPTFVGLEQLEVKMHMYNGLFLLWPTILIKAAPILRTFTVKLKTEAMSLARKCSNKQSEDHVPLDGLIVGYTPSLTDELVRNIMSASSVQQHECLKVIEIHNFVGNESDLMLAEHLFHMPFPSLKKVILSTSPNSLFPFPDCSTGRRFQVRSRERATRIKEWASPSVEVVIY